MDKNDKKHPRTNNVEETVHVKWCVSKVPQYMFKHIHKINITICGGLIPKLSQLLNKCKC